MFSCSLPARSVVRSVFFALLFALLFVCSAGAHARAAPDTFANVVKKVAGAVVDISTTQEIEVKNPFSGFRFNFKGAPENDLFREFFDREFGSRKQKATSLGSGFIIDPAGYIVTNHHVISDAEEITITLSGGDDKDIYKARVVGTDPKTDLALLKIDAKVALPYVKFGDSTKYEVGDWIITVGNPFGLGSTVTAGIISAKSRHIGAYDEFIQTDAPINRGNSGGPMFSLDGTVIGVNSVIVSPPESGGSVGIGFAIPSSLAEPIINQLKKDGKVVRGSIGVKVQRFDDKIAKTLGLNRARGALVSEVVEGTPASRAGVKVGDIILKFNNIDIKDSSHLPRVVASAPIGKRVSMDILRDKKKISLFIKTQVSDAQEEDSPTKKSSKTYKSAGLSFVDITDNLRARYKINKDVHGTVVVRVSNDSPASLSMIQLGDVVTRVNQRKVDSAAELKEILDSAVKKNVSNVVLMIYRGGNNYFTNLDITE